MEPLPPRTVASLIPGRLTARQLELLEQFERAAEALGEVVPFGEIAVTFHGGNIADLTFSNKYRPKAH